MAGGSGTWWAAGLGEEAAPCTGERCQSRTAAHGAGQKQRAGWADLGAERHLGFQRVELAGVGGGVPVAIQDAAGRQRVWGEAQDLTFGHGGSKESHAGRDRGAVRTREGLGVRAAGAQQGEVSAEKRVEMLR